jgi:5-hydroxyisourate hydrolase-like protein (transthyretin family)
MAQNGYLTARVYTANESIPIKDAVVTVIKNDSSTSDIIAKRTTDKNGLILPVAISAPDKSLSLQPGAGDVFSLVDVRIDKEGYYTVYIKNVQIFSGQTTVADTPMIPLPDNQKYNDKSEDFVETPQNL